MPRSRLEELRDEIKRKLTERNKHKRSLDEMLNAATARGRRELNDGEARKFQTLKRKITDLDDELDELRAEKDAIEDLELRDDDRRDLAREIQPTADRRPAHVRSEPLVYGPGGSKTFFADAVAVHLRVPRAGAAERFGRHMAEVRGGEHGDEFRDGDSGSFGALVVPNYLPEMYAEVLRSGRTTAELCTHEDLPDEGMTITIPRGTTGTLVDVQATENTAVTSRDLGVVDLVFDVNTYGGQVNVSRQAVERGRGTDEILFRDMANDYAVKLNRDVLAGPGTGGRHLGIDGSVAHSVTWSVALAAVTPGNFAVKLADAIQRVNSTRFLPVDAIVMAPRRWGWLTSASDSAGRPLFVPEANVPQNVLGVGEPAAVGLVGQIQGVPTYTDPGISITTSNGGGGTGNEDVVYVFRRGDLHLWEDSPVPRQFRFEETLGDRLTIKLVVADYSAFTAKHHPEGVARITGSALVTPVF